GWPDPHERFPTRPPCDRPSARPMCPALLSPQRRYPAPRRADLISGCLAVKSDWRTCQKTASHSPHSYTSVGRLHTPLCASYVTVPLQILQAALHYPGEPRAFLSRRVTCGTHGALRCPSRVQQVSQRG